MIYRKFGNTGLKVSLLGFGAGHIGSERNNEESFGRLLHEVLESGINLIDTARAYGQSEERIGKYISHRRHEFIISTKVGYNSHWHPDWSYETVLSNIDDALLKLRTDYLDIVHLHSCGQDVLERGDATIALEKAKEAGKIRFLAYSGENEALDYAIRSQKFSSIQTSVNFCDQNGLKKYLPAAKSGGMGVIAKRPIANAPWRHEHPPVGHYSEEYWHRWKKMNPDPHGLPWDELALRFTLFSDGVDTGIIGTSSPDHLRSAIEAAEKGPLSTEIREYLENRFCDCAQNWQGLI